MFLYDGTERSKEFIPIYSWWASVLIFDLLCFTWFTGRVRVRTETIHSDEDRMWMKKPTLCTSGGGHPDLDHIRAGHFTDLSLTMPFLIIAMIWLNTSPPPLLASIILRVFPIAKILHSIFYMRVIEAPKILATLSLALCYATLVYMTITSVYFFYA